MLVIEKDVELCLKNRVKGLGGICLKFPTIYAEGIPDRLVILPHGKIAFVELKRPQGGRLSAVQSYQIAKLRGLEVKVYVVKNFKEVEDMLEELQNDE